MNEDRGTLQRRGEDIIMVLDLKSFFDHCYHDQSTHPLCAELEKAVSHMTPSSIAVNRCICSAYGFPGADF